jgi:predicted  nucleic acid-binding Zn ribbon protein
MMGRTLKCPWPECGKTWHAEYAIADYVRCPHCRQSLEYRWPRLVETVAEGKKGPSAT